MLCVCDIEEREHGVGAGVNATMLFRNTIGHKPRKICCKGVSIAKKTHEPEIKQKVCIYYDG